MPPSLGVAWPWFLLGVTLVGLVKLYRPDTHPLSDALRLIVQFASVFLMFCQFGILSWHDWWAVAIALTVSVGILNAYNFMDGINGITGGYSLAVLAPLIYLNHTLGFMPQSFLYVVGLGVLVFCYFNFRKKARCFAGDVGSITMAFIIVFALGNQIIRTGTLRMSCSLLYMAPIRCLPSATVSCCVKTCSKLTANMLMS